MDMIENKIKLTDGDFLDSKTKHWDEVLESLGDIFDEMDDYNVTLIETLWSRGFDDGIKFGTDYIKNGFFNNNNFNKDNMDESLKRYMELLEDRLLSQWNLINGDKTENNGKVGHFGWKTGFYMGAHGFTKILKDKIEDINRMKSVDVIEDNNKTEFIDETEKE
jgi:hypothetical protein